MLQKTTKVKGSIRKPAVEEVPEQIKTDTKSLKRLQIQDEVFDNSDAIADNAKMISLLLSTISKMYNTFTDTQKNKLSIEDKTLIEYTFDKFGNANTRADNQLQEEGTELVDKLIQRQETIGNILK